MIYFCDFYEKVFHTKNFYIIMKELINIILYKQYFTLKFPLLFIGIEQMDVAGRSRNEID